MFMAGCNDRYASRYSVIMSLVIASTMLLHGCDNMFTRLSILCNNRVANVCKCTYMYMVSVIV